MSCFWNFQEAALCCWQLLQRWLQQWGGFCSHSLVFINFQCVISAANVQLLLMCLKVWCWLDDYLCHSKYLMRRSVNFSHNHKIVWEFIGLNYNMSHTTICYLYCFQRVSYIFLGNLKWRGGDSESVGMNISYIVGGKCWSSNARSHADGRHCSHWSNKLIQAIEICECTNGSQSRDFIFQQSLPKKCVTDSTKNLDLL